MTYRIVKTPKAWWPVHVPGVMDDGTPVTNSFEMRFRLLDEEEITALDEIEAGASENGDASAIKLAIKAAAEVVMAIAEDWRGVEQEDGDGGAASLPFTPDNVATLVKLPNVASAIIRAFRACRAGEVETRRGN